MFDFKKHISRFNMWPQLVLFVLVGLACASNNPGWKDDTEYVYMIRGRTLASLDQISDEYSGILLKAKLTLQTRHNGHLRAKLSEAQYAEIHTHLPEGWNQDVNDQLVNYQPLPMTSSPFEIVVSEGVVRDLIVDQELSEWEANIIKSIVSQIQLDTSSQKSMEGPVNSASSKKSNSAAFKTLEDTVTGITETSYDIHPLPEYILQSKPWLAPFPNLKGDGEVIEIVKNKNFTKNEYLPAYNFGLSGFAKWGSGNQLGEVLTRTSAGHAVITGTLEHFTIQHSSTVNKIIINPSFNDNEKGSVVSFINMTLSHIEQHSSQFNELSRPIHLGTLVYRYNQKNFGTRVAPGPANSQIERDHIFLQGNHHPLVSSFEKKLLQQNPKLNEAPNTPLLPLTMGYKGQSVKLSQKVDIVQVVSKLAQIIGQDFKEIDSIPKNNVLARFVLLSSTIRAMNENELQQVTQQLYHEGEEDKPVAWMAFRDATAEAGTGPAFLTIRKWIVSQKIKHGEAAQIIDTMSQAVRQPTEEFIRNYFNLIVNPQVIGQSALYESAILSFSNLLYNVFVDEKYSHMEYPIDSFGDFDTETGELFVEKEYIPYLTKQLQKAVFDADARKIHLYIRALGNVGHRKILATFEPYLEGKKQCSQFQRLLMVIAMDKLVTVDPTLARSVLYRLYQNSGEVQEVRVAAVYQLMRTHPPTDMLQRMAQFTNEDTREDVNAAVKSAIESISELEGIQFAKLRSSAKAARTLLTTKQYGIQFSREYLRSYVTKEVNSYIKHTVQTIVSEDSGLPNAIKYSFRTGLNGYSSQVVNVQAMISSIDELVDVFSKQTEEHQRNQESQQRSQQSQKSVWSSEKIARILGMQSQDREQLESSLYLKLGDFHKFLAFDNHSIECLSEWVRSAEDSLKTGISFEHMKFINRGEMAIALPTETGLPFLYTYDMPILLTMKGRVRGKVEPQVSSGKKIAKPDTIELDTEIRAVLSGKIQSQIGFITPFNHKRYSAGYDKNVQFHLPIRSKFNIDLKNQRGKAEVESLDPEGSSTLFHYSTWPYTSEYDILELQPVAGMSTTKIIKKMPQRTMDQVFGQNTFGMAFRVRGTTGSDIQNIWTFAQKLRTHDSHPLKQWLFGNIEHSEINVEYSGKLSDSKKTTFRMGYEQKWQPQSKDATAIDIKNLSKMFSDSKTRKEEMLKESASGINQADAHVLDTVIEFSGKHVQQIVATLGIAKSSSDPKSRVLFYLTQKSTKPSSRPFELAFSVKSSSPVINSLDMEYALKFDPSSTSQMELAFGENLHSGSKINALMQVGRSASRLQYLKRHPLYHQCKLELGEGNNQLSACSYMTETANLLDQIKIKATYENLDYQTLNNTYKLYSAIRFLTYYNFDEKLGNGNEDNQVELEASFAPDFTSVNISLATQTLKARIMDLKLKELSSPFIAMHPMFSTHLRGNLHELQTYKPICVVDKTAAKTLDNRAYPLDLSNVWTVMLQYLPIRAHQKPMSVEDQLKQELENHVVLIRDRAQGSDLKEVKIIVAVPETLGGVSEIDLLPSAGRTLPKVLIDGRPVIISQDHSYVDEAGILQVYALPNQEVKVEVRNEYYVIFDGFRAKLTILSSKFRKSVRGLCGTFTGEPTTDFLTPNNHIVREPQVFAASYAVLQKDQQNQEIMELKARASKNYNIHKDLRQYADIISEQDFDNRKHKHQEQDLNSCSELQTLYVLQNGQICFTIKPMIVCRSECKQQGIINKDVAALCVESNKVSKLWKSQIDNGDSPDFSSKIGKDRIRMNLPRSCIK